MAAAGAGARSRTWLHIAATLLVVAACSGGGTGRGAVIAVDGDLTSVARFTVLTEDGERFTLTPDPDTDYDFPLPHLRDHLQTGDPVVFEYEVRDGVLVLTAIQDG